MLRTLPLALATALLALALAPASPASAALPKRPLAYAHWDAATFGDGTYAGTRVAKGALVADTATGHRRFAGRRYESSAWLSPWTTPGFGLTQLISSWSARTPGTSWIEVQVRGQDTDGHTSSWDVLGRWAADDTYVDRASVAGQGDDLGKVDVDTWTTTTALTTWQAKVVLMREAGAASPRVLDLGAVASALPSTADVPTSKPTGVAAGVTLPVPRYSQMAHTGDYPQWDGGGEAWCSPTSTSMVLGYYGDLPDSRLYKWVPPDHTDPWVDYAARQTYDHTWDGTGNWPFNTAYAAGLTGHAFVTRLRSLREAERFIAAGIPLVASISFKAGRLTGSPVSASNGHLLVIVGFTDTGDVVVNDPAAKTRKGVRRTYDRGQFEDAWLPTSGGLVYVVTDDAHPLPDPDTHTNW